MDNNDEEQVTTNFTKVDALRPETSGHNIHVKVVSSKEVVNRAKGDGTKIRVNECLVGDDTGVVIFTAKNEQVDKVTEGKTLTLKNAKVEMYRGCVRLMVDKSGAVEDAEEGVDVKPKEDNNLSEVEYELISIP